MEMAACPAFDELCEGRVDLTPASCVGNDDLLPEGLCRFCTSVCSATVSGWLGPTSMAMVVVTHSTNAAPSRRPRRCERDRRHMRVAE
jgi:hypothetical protein